MCDGVADEAIINAAIAELEGVGGCIELSEGAFNAADSIILSNRIWLRGQGYSTNIVGEAGIDVVVVPELMYAKISDISIHNEYVGLRCNAGARVLAAGCAFYGTLTNTAGVWLHADTYGAVSFCDFMTNAIGVSAHGTAFMATNNYFADCGVDMIAQPGTCLAQDNNITYTTT